MTKISKNEARRRQRALTVLAGLGALAAGWAFFLWYQLLRARAGIEPFCAFGEAGDCAQLWDGAFAGTVHRITGLPVAGWGLVWGMAALLLALIARGDAENESKGVFRGAEGAIRLVGAAGLVGVAILIGASLREGGFCANCVVTYALTIAYGALALRRLRAPIFSESALFSAALLVVASYLLLLYPGLRTPKNVRDAGQQAVAEAAQRAATGDDPSPATGAEALPADVAGFIASLQPELRQFLSDLLEQHRGRPALPTEPPRAPLGDPASPVLITEFVDVKCSHCADLHQTMSYILSAAPGRFALDSRHYPLDGACNPRLPGAGSVETVRCLAARVQICAEGSPDRFELGGDLFARQAELDEALVYEIAAKYLPQMALDACLADPSTEAKLQADVAYAGRYDPRGTPLVLVNGRESSPYGPLLYALVLAGGDLDHPAFADLPPPRELPEHDHDHDHDHDH